MLSYQDLSEGFDSRKSISEEEAIQLIKEGKRVNIFGAVDAVQQTVSFLKGKDVKVLDMQFAKTGSAYCRVNAPDTGSLQSLQASW